MIIGITGNSGTGKTEITKILAEKMDAEIIDADKIVKEMTEIETEYLIKIIELFGQEILKENNKLNRKKLAKIIYNNNLKREELNKLTFKYIGEKIEEKTKISKKQNIIIDAPLLFECKLDKLCDITISVIAKENIKINRICKRDNITKEEAKARLDIQKQDRYYIEKSNYIIENNGKIEEINLEEICTKIGKS